MRDTVEDTFHNDAANKQFSILKLLIRPFSFVSDDDNDDYDAQFPSLLLRLAFRPIHRKLAAILQTIRSSSRSYLWTICLQLPKGKSH